MKKQNKTILSILLFIAFIAIAVFAYNTLSSKFKPKDNFIVPASSTPTDSESDSDTALTPAPDFTVYDKDGNTVKLSDFFGKPIVLNFWATWCTPCKKEMPVFNSAYKSLKDDINFLMVEAIDNQNETIQKGKKFIEKEGYVFPILFDSDMDAVSIYGINSLPTTIFIDSDGNIVAGHKGMLDEEILLKGIDLIMNTTANSPQTDIDAKAVYHNITAEEAKKMRETDDTITLIDVRTEKEYAEKRIEGSILIPDYEIEQRAPAELPDKQATILIYCRSGARSKSAANKLVSMGYTNVYDLGGINSYPFDTVSDDTKK